MVKFVLYSSSLYWYFAMRMAKSAFWFALMATAHAMMVKTPKLMAKMALKKVNPRLHPVGVRSHSNTRRTLRSMQEKILDGRGSIFPSFGVVFDGLGSASGVCASD